jgi:hypothetical protein
MIINGLHNNTLVDVYDFHGQWAYVQFSDAVNNVDWGWVYGPYLVCE